MLTVDKLVELTDVPSGNAGQLAGIVAATNAYIKRYRGDTPWTDDTMLGAAQLARGLWRDGYSPSIGEGWEQQGNVFARLTDVKIEQLLRIGRFAPPVVG